MELTAVIDDEKLLKTFQRLPRTTRTRAIRPALRKGANVISRMARVNVKAVANKGYATDTLVKNIRSYNLRDFKGMARVAVTVKRGAVNKNKIVNGEPVRVGLYAAVLEYGKKGQAPASWIRKAAREGTDEATDEILKETRKRLPEAVEKAKR